MSNQVKSFLFSPFKKKRNTSTTRKTTTRKSTASTKSDSYGRDAKGRLKKGYKIDQKTGKTVKA